MKGPLPCHSGKTNHWKSKQKVTNAKRPKPVPLAEALFRGLTEEGKAWLMPGWQVGVKKQTLCSVSLWQSESLFLLDCRPSNSWFEATHPDSTQVLSLTQFIWIWNSSTLPSEVYIVSCQILEGGRQKMPELMAVVLCWFLILVLIACSCAKTKTKTKPRTKVFVRSR